MDTEFQVQVDQAWLRSGGHAATARRAAFDVVAILAACGAVQVVLTVAVEPPSPLVVQVESAEQRLAVRLAGHSDPWVSS